MNDEFQIWNSRLGNGSPLANPDINAQFAVDNTYYDGKNVRAFFYNKPAEPAKKHPKESEAAFMMDGVLHSLFHTTNPQQILQRMEEQWNQK